MKNSKFIIAVVFLIVLIFAGCQGVKTSEFEEINSEEELIEKLQGFWFFAGNGGELSEDVKRDGMAFEIQGMKLNIYSDFKIEAEGVNITIIDSDTIKFYNGENTISMDVSFKKANGYNLMLLNDGSTIGRFENIDKETYMLYKGFKEVGVGSYDYSTYLEDELTDKELEWYISDMYWNELYYACSDGSTEEMNPFSMVMYSVDMTGTMQYVDETLYVGWEVYDSKLYLTYEDGETYYFPIDYVFDEESGYSYLYLYDTDEGYEDCAWILWDLVETDDN